MTIDDAWRQIVPVGVDHLVRLGQLVLFTDGDDRPVVHRHSGLGTHTPLGRDDGAVSHYEVCWHTIRLFCRRRIKPVFLQRRTRPIK